MEEDERTSERCREKVRLEIIMSKWKRVKEGRNRRKMLSYSGLERMSL